jgi:hypothetical protein
MDRKARELRAAGLLIVLGFADGRHQLYPGKKDVDLGPVQLSPKHTFNIPRHLSRANPLLISQFLISSSQPEVLYAIHFVPVSSLGNSSGLYAPIFQLRTILPADHL